MDHYFNFDSLSSLIERCGFKVIHKEATFPIDIFLLMGDDYVGNDAVGRVCHTKRMNFEKAITQSGSSNLLSDLYLKIAELGIGREIVIYSKKA